MTKRPPPRKPEVIRPPGKGKAVVKPVVKPVAKAVPKLVPKAVPKAAAKASPTKEKIMTRREYKPEKKQKPTQLSEDAAAIRIQFEGATMPATIHVGQTIVATATEYDENGAPVTIPNPATLTWTSSTPEVATALTNADGTATYTAVAPGQAIAQVTDAENDLSTEDTLTVEAAVPLPPTTIRIAWSEARFH